MSSQAVLQKDLSIPSPEALKRAFRAVKSLTDVDARILANDAYGILVRRLPAGEAIALQAALSSEGIETELVEERRLPQLPPAKFVRRLDCLPGSLVIYDPLGRGFPLEWRHILMIAAGRVRLSEFKRIDTVQRVTRYNAAGDAYTETVRDHHTKEELNELLLLEIVLAGAPLRYSARADKFDFRCLGERRTGDARRDFESLVRDLANFAPDAAVNRGAYYMRQQASEVFAYPSKNAFFEEITWLLWKLNPTA